MMMMMMMMMCENQPMYENQWESRAMAQTESLAMVESFNFTQKCTHGKSPDCCTASLAYFRHPAVKKKESLRFNGSGNKLAISKWTERQLNS
jgi:hypothetical protein